MKYLVIIAALFATPTFADGPSTFSEPPVTKPVCAYQFLFWKWNGECYAKRSNSPDSVDAVPVGGPDSPPANKQPERGPERDKPTYTPSGEVRANPGNDKPVGRAGEKPEKNMDERSPAGNRGRSN